MADSSPRDREVLAEMRRAESLDPIMPIVQGSSVGIHVYAGEHERAEDLLARAIELEPDNGLACFHMGASYRIRGKPKEAIRALQQSHRSYHGGRMGGGSLAVAYVMIGERGQAELILQRLLGRRDHQYTSALCLAVVFSALGEIEEALEWLDSAIEERDSLLPLINILRLFDELEDKPRYRALLDRLRLA